MHPCPWNDDEGLARSQERRAEARKQRQLDRVWFFLGLLLWALLVVALAYAIGRP